MHEAPHGGGSSSGSVPGPAPPLAPGAQLRRRLARAAPRPTPSVAARRVPAATPRRAAHRRATMAPIEAGATMKAPSMWRCNASPGLLPAEGMQAILKRTHLPVPSIQQPSPQRASAPTAVQVHGVRGADHRLGLPSRPTAPVSRGALEFIEAFSGVPRASPYACPVDAVNAQARGLHGSHCSSRAPARLVAPGVDPAPPRLHLERQLLSLPAIRGLLALARLLLNELIHCNDKHPDPSDRVNPQGWCQPRFKPWLR